VKENGRIVGGKEWQEKIYEVCPESIKPYLISQEPVA
jgi:hypothetical protein